MLFLCWGKTWVGLIVWGWAGDMELPMRVLVYKAGADQPLPSQSTRQTTNHTHQTVKKGGRQGLPPAVLLRGAGHLHAAPGMGVGRSVNRLVWVVKLGWVRRW